MEVGARCPTLRSSAFVLRTLADKPARKMPGQTPPKGSGISFRPLTRPELNNKQRSTLQFILSYNAPTEELSRASACLATTH